MAYRILIWSGPQARLVDHDAVDGDAMLDRLASAGRAALGLPPRGGDAQHTRLARAHRHLARAVKLLEEI